MTANEEVSQNGAGPVAINDQNGLSPPRNLQVLFCATPATGHLIPLYQIARHLVKRGYDVTFLGSTLERPAIERTGAKFASHVGYQNFSSANIPERFPEIINVPKGMDGLAWVSEHIWARSIPSAHESVRLALAAMHRRAPEKEIIIVCETWFTGLLAMQLGAEPPEGFNKLPPSLGISIVPPAFASIDQGPLGTGLPFDNSETGRARNALIAKLMADGLFSSATKARDTLLKVSGATRPCDSLLGDHADLITPGIFDAAFVAHDTVLQMCLPALEYPYSDWPSHVKFGGTLPPKARDPTFVAPAWFDIIRANSSTLDPSDSRKKIVMVSQGTVALDWTDIVIPTITGLAEREDIIVVAVLCMRGAKIDEHLKKVPSNAIVVDWIDYDEILMSTDVIVSNGSYGIIGHAIASGVPMVLGGHSEDKPENGMRAEQAGFAVNLRTGMPTKEMVAAAVDKILGDEKYKRRARELQKEAAEFDALGNVEREMLALLN